MGAPSKSVVVAVAFLFVAAVFTIACDRPATPPAASEEPASVATMTSAELTPGNETGNDTRNGYRDAVRREQRDLDGRIQEALGTLDRRLGTRPADRAQLLRARQRLAADQRLVAKSDERGWDELKAEVERDVLQVEGHVTEE